MISQNTVKNAATVVTIYHFDDEPDSVDWIPDALFNHYRLRHPSWVDGDVEEEWDDDEQSVFFSFQLREPCPVTIRYRIYRSPELFEEQFLPEPHDVVILDMMTEMPDGSLQPKGMEFYQLAVESDVKAGRTYVLTAFPGQIRNKLPELTDDHLIVKPPDAAQVIKMITDNLADVLKPEDDHGN